MVEEIESNNENDREYTGAPLIRITIIRIV